MKIQMKLFITITIAIAISSNICLAQLSDYQITQNFKNDYEIIKGKVTKTMTINDLDTLHSNILNLQNKYQAHDEIINSALFPSRYDEMMGELNELLLSSEHRLVLIENQQEQISNLSQRLTAFEYEVDHLRTETNKLRSDLSKSAIIRSDLSNKLAEYRVQIEKRDRIIVTYVDTMIKEYNALRKQAGLGLNELNQDQIALNSLNLLELIQSVIDDHYADEASNYQLMTIDYIRMYVIAQQFEEVINQVEDHVVGVYTANVNTDSLKQRLFDLQVDLEDKTWTSIQQQMYAMDIETESFYDKTTFVKTLDSHIQSHIMSNEDNPFIENQYDEYLAFNTFWNDVLKGDWGVPMIESGLISTQQIAYLDESLSKWYSLAKPQSYMLQLLAGFLILLVISLGIVIWKLY